jgi:Holliday junction resolvasome RuvABC endonuclease subunit
MRWVLFRQLFNELLSVSQPKIVAYEAVSFHPPKGGVAVPHSYGAIVSHLQEICYSRGFDYCGIQVPTIKKHATGKGNANKAAMVKAAREKWPRFAKLLKDDNAADAAWIADYAAYMDRFSVPTRIVTAKEPT